MAGWSACPLFYWSGTLEHVLHSCLKTLRLQLCWIRDQILMDAVSMGQKLAKKTKPSESFSVFAGWPAFAKNSSLGILSLCKGSRNHIAVTMRVSRFGPEDSVPKASVSAVANKWRCNKETFSPQTPPTCSVLESSLCISLNVEGLYLCLCRLTANATMRITGRSRRMTSKTTRATLAEDRLWCRGATVSATSEMLRPSETFGITVVGPETFPGAHKMFKRSASIPSCRGQSCLCMNGQPFHHTC